MKHRKIVHGSDEKQIDDYDQQTFAPRLPPEILDMLFKHYDVFDMSRVGSVCSYWDSFVKSTLESETFEIWFDNLWHAKYKILYPALDCLTFFKLVNSLFLRPYFGIKSQSTKNNYFDPLVIKRLHQELSKLRDVNDSVCAFASPNDIMTWKALIRGPKDSPYEDGLFFLKLNFTEKFPTQPPKIYFLTKILHPGVNDETGEMCVDVIDSGWEPNITVEAILLSVQSMLSNPHPNEYAFSATGKLYKEDKNEFENLAREWTNEFGRINCSRVREEMHHLPNKELVPQLISESPIIESWKKEVVEKLLEIFKEAECELIARVLWYLSEEEKTMKEDNANANAETDGDGIKIQVQIPPGLKALKATIDWEELFTHYARHLAQETKEPPERNAAFLKDMKIVFEEMTKRFPLDELVSVDLSESESEADPYDENKDEQKQNDAQAHGNTHVNESDKDKFVLVRTSDCDGDGQKQDEHFNGHSQGGHHGVLSHLWGWVELATKHALIKAIPPIFVNPQFMFALVEFINIVDHAGDTVIKDGLVGVCLSFEAIKNLYHWWGGQITGKRCAKNLVDATFMVGGGVLGGIGDAALGSAMGGPFGTVAGGIISGIVSSQVLHALCGILTQTLFDLPKDAALENAFNYLGVPTSATNAEINAAFRKKCLQHHPDKGGKSEDFILLQANMSVIKLARGELL